LVDTLIERRNKIGRRYFEGVLPIDHFTVNGGVLRFANLASICGFSDDPEYYSLSWFEFENETERKNFVGQKSQAKLSEIAVPAELLSGNSPYFGVDVEVGSKRVSVFIHRQGLRVVGIDRGSVDAN